MFDKLKSGPPDCNLTKIRSVTTKRKISVSIRIVRERKLVKLCEVIDQNQEREVNRPRNRITHLSQNFGQ